MTAYTHGDPTEYQIPQYTKQAHTSTKLPNNTLKKVLSTLSKCWNISKTNVSWRVEVLSFCSTANGTQDPVQAELALYPHSQPQHRICKLKTTHQVTQHLSQIPIGTTPTKSHPLHEGRLLLQQKEWKEMKTPTTGKGSLYSERI